MKRLLLSILLFSVVLASTGIVSENPEGGPAAVVPEDGHPAEISSALMAHVEENGLDRVMRVKRYCGCCGGISPSICSLQLLQAAVAVAVCVPVCPRPLAAPAWDAVDNLVLPFSINLFILLFILSQYSLGNCSQ